MRNTHEDTRLLHTIDELKKRVAILEADLQKQERIAADKQHAEETYQSLFKNMPNGLAYCRVLFINREPDDFIYLNVNDAFETLTGLKDVAGKKASEVIPGLRESDPKLLEICGRVAMTGYSERFEMYIEALQQWFSISVYSPRKEHFVTIFDAITERRQAEIAAQESEERFHRLIEGSPEAIFIQTEGKFVYVNQAAARLFGVESPDLLIGQRLIDYFHPDFHIKASERTRQTNIEQRAVPRHEEVILQSGGKAVDIEVSAIPFAYKGKKGGLVFLRDVTDRKRAEKKLQVALTKYKTLFDLFPNGITVADNSGKIVETNRMAAKILGLPQEEHTNRLIDSREWQLIRPDGSVMPPEEFASIRALKENRLIENMEMGIVKLSGKVTWIDVSATPLPLDGYGVIITYADITKRKHAEDELHLSKMKLHLALEAANAGTWEWNLRTNENIWSDEVWKLYGLNPHRGKATYDLWLESMHPDDRNKAEQAVQEAVSRGCELNIEWRVVDKTGNVRWLMARGKPVRNIAEQIESFIGITIDITYRKRAELALREESVRRRILFEQAKDGIVVLDQDRKVVEANKSFADMLGYTMEEMHQLHPWDWDVNYSTREEMVAMWPELPTTRDTIETRHRRKDGSVYDVEISWNPAEWDGQWQLYCVCRDITDRKQAEAALRESERKFKVIADHTYDFEGWLDPQGDYIYASPSCERIYGYDSIEFMSDPSLRSRVVHPEDRARFDEHLRTVEAAHTHGEIEFRILRSDGSIRWIEHACQPVFDEQGIYLGVRGSNRDITDRKQAETALKESSVRFHQALTAAQAGAWEVNLLTGEHTWSEELWHLFGIEPGSIKTSFDTWLQLVHPDQREDARQHIEKTMRTGGEFVYEWQMSGKYSKEHWFMTRCTPINNDAGQPERLMGIVIDITERKQAEKH